MCENWRRFIQGNLTPEQEKALIYESDLIADLQLCWQPHDAQAKVKNSIFSQGKKKIFLECGRKFGKTDIGGYIEYRFALLYPNSSVYYIAPFQKQAKELIWANNRLQNFFLPKVDPKTGVSHTGLNHEECYQVFEELKAKYGMKINNTEMRITFGNGSFIKLDGADQFEAYRGVNPHLILYDEFKDHHPKFHDAMDPNLATFQAPLVIVGTPPEGDEDNAKQYWEMADYCKVAKDGAHFHYSSFANPHIDKDYLYRKRDELILRNKEDTWKREYMAERVKAGSRSIFPMFEAPQIDLNIVHTRHVRPHEEIQAMVKKHHKDWDFFLTFDPASASTFAVLFGAINRMDKRVVILDEVYEQDKGKMSTSQIFPKALKLLEGYPILQDEVRMIYDNAATWFANEVSFEFGFGLEPCMKDVKKKGEDGKEDRLNLIKDMYIYGYLFVSEKCKNFINETKNYRTDDKGKIPKEDDHLLDALRYSLAAFYYNHVPIKEELVVDDRRGFTIEQDRREDIREKDPYADIFEEYYL